MDRTRMPWEPDSNGIAGIPEDSSGHAGHRYATGQAIYSGQCRGTVAAVGKTTMDVIWSDGDSPITYPIDAPYLRKAMPWE